MLVVMAKYKTQSKFAEAVDTAPAYLSQLKKGVHPSGKPVSIGDDLARKIEERLGLEFGWMDRSHTEVFPDSLAQSKELEHVDQPENLSLLISRLKKMSESNELSDELIHVLNTTVNAFSTIQRTMKSSDQEPEKDEIDRLNKELFDDV